MRMYGRAGTEEQKWPWDEAVCPDWEAEDLVDRLDRCLALLCQRSVVVPHEAESAMERIYRLQCRRDNARGVVSGQETD